MVKGEKLLHGYRLLSDFCREKNIEHEYARTICDMNNIGVLMNSKLYIDKVDEKSIQDKHDKAQENYRKLSYSTANDVEILHCSCGYQNEYRAETINKNTRMWLLCENCGAKYNITAKMIRI